MFDIGWTELLVIAVVAILVVGPKELPGMLRTVGQFMGKMRRMASEFQSTFNDAVREAERQADLDDIKKSVGDMKSLDPFEDVRDSMNPLSAMESTTKSTKSITPTGTSIDDTGTDVVDEAVAEMNPDDGLDEPASETPAAAETETVAEDAENTPRKSAGQGKDTLT